MDGAGSAAFRATNCDDVIHMQPEFANNHVTYYYCSMTATTVKLEGDLLLEIQAHKPPHQTLAAYVRQTLQADLRRRRMATAAQEYSAFLAANPAERDEMDEWAQAPLATPVKRRNT